MVCGGWSWFSWSRELTQYVLTYIGSHPKYLKRFLHTSAADELIFNTIVHSQLKDLDVESLMPLRFVSWSLKRKLGSNEYRPYTLNHLDYDEIIDKQAFFCRKVDLPESEKLLDMIDAQRGGTFCMDEAEHLFPHLLE